MHTIDVILYIIAVAAFGIGLIDTIRTTPMTKLGAMFWLFLGLLAWVLVPAFATWGVFD